METFLDKKIDRIHKRQDRITDTIDGLKRKVKAFNKEIQRLENENKRLERGAMYIHERTSPSLKRRKKIEAERLRKESESLKFI